jgi:hypothetical protein
MADDVQKKVLDELVLIRWLLIFIAALMGVLASVFVLAVMK